MTNDGNVIVTLLFTDMVDSTRLWADFPDLMPDALQRHDDIIDRAVTAHGGTVFKRTGDGVNAVFGNTSAALGAAADAQRALVAAPWATTPPVRARMAVHTGPVLPRDGDYFGMLPNMAARLRDAGHGVQILASEAVVAAVADDPPAGMTLVPLGVHRLRGIPGQHRIFQVVHPGLPVRFAPLRTLDPATGVAVPATSLFGRTDELTRLSRLLERPGTITLVGAGGVGKTRLAVEVAAEAGHRFRDGVRLIDLAPVNADGVPAAVAAGLGLVRRGRHSFRDSIIEWLRWKRVLLVVDNCEHVLPVASRLVCDITAASQEATVLCTSRQPLGFLGEIVVPVDPLAVPATGDDSLEDSPAVRMFADRAEAAHHGLAVGPEHVGLVAEICRRLDGIPLAIELAAARARSIGLHDLLDHIHSASPLLATATPDHPRHRTLLTTIQWSYDLLPSESRRLFDRLSVFSGSWTVGAAHEVCAADNTVPEVLALLADLADRSMIVADLGPGDTRYRMLATLREFAADRLSETSETAERRNRHAEFYVGLAQAADAGLRSSAESDWVLAVAADFSNLQAAHVWCLENDAVDREARLLVSLWNYGLQRLSAEYFHWVEKSLDRLSFDDHQLLPELLGIAALGAWLRGDLRQCARFCRASFDAEKRLGSGASLQARMSMVYIAAYGPPAFDPELAPIVAESPVRFLEVVKWARALGDPFWLVYTMAIGSFGLALVGDDDRATKLARRALEKARASGCPTSIAWALSAVATHEQSEAAQAEALVEEALGEARRVESRFVLGQCLSLSAILRRRLGRPLDAVPLLLELLDHWDRLGNRPQLWHTLREAAMCLGLIGATEPAVRLLASIEGSEVVAPMFPADHAELAALNAQLRRALGEATYAEARAEGARLSREETLLLATRALSETAAVAAPA